MTGTNDVETHLGAVYGLRRWAVGPDNRLVSPYANAMARLKSKDTVFGGALVTTWGVGDLTAKCGSPKYHDQWIINQRWDGNTHPGALCVSCGFYSYSTIGIFQYHELASFDAVYGIISCWGTIMQGPNGQRSQHARIVALIAPESTTRAPWWYRKFGCKISMSSYDFRHWPSSLASPKCTCRSWFEAHESDDGRTASEIGHDSLIESQSHRHIGDVLIHYPGLKTYPHISLALRDYGLKYDF